MPRRSNKAATSSVTVVGSLNVDLIASLNQLPAPGETVSSSQLRKLFGGKGANQAIAAACHGARVSMIGCVGGDADGIAYIERMKAFGIDTSGITVDTKSLTGTALIGVSATGENLIMVAAEANSKLSANWVRSCREQVTSASALLLQWEVPMKAVLASIQLANKVSVPVVMNPSPLGQEFPWGSVKVDYLIVNEGEAHSIFRLSPELLAQQTNRWRSAMKKRGISTLIITRGSDSTLALDAQCFIEAAVPRVTPLDTVGAGDCFAGTFTASLAQGNDLKSSISAANRVAARSTLTPGAQPEPRSAKRRR